MVAAFLLRRRRPIQGLAVVGLVSYGAWLMYRPAGFVVAGLLLLLDLVTDRAS